MLFSMFSFYNLFFNYTFTLHLHVLLLQEEKMYNLHAIDILPFYRRFYMIYIILYMT